MRRPREKNDFEKLICLLLHQFFFFKCRHFVNYLDALCESPVRWINPQFNHRCAQPPLALVNYAAWGQIKLWKLHKVAFLAKWDYLQLCLYSCMYDMNPVWVENIGSAVWQFWLIPFTWNSDSQFWLAVLPELLQRVSLWSSTSALLQCCDKR